MRTVLPARLDELWPGLKQIIRIERRSELKHFCRRQVIYAITSLAPGKHGAPELLALARDHWRIENSCFHVRDVTFMEDLCRVRSGNAPQALAFIRDATLRQIKARGLLPRPAREAFAANPKSAIRQVVRS